MESYWGNNPHSRAGPMPGSRWPAQNKLSAQNGHFFANILTPSALFGPFFFFLILTGLLLVSCGFWFCIFMDFVSVFLVFSFVLFCFKCFSLLYLPACFLKREGMELAEWRGGEDVEGNGRKETMIWIYCRKNYFRQYIKWKYAWATLSSLTWVIILLLLTGAPATHTSVVFSQ